MSTRAEIEAELKSENEALQKRVAELESEDFLSGGRGNGTFRPGGD